MAYRQGFRVYRRPRGHEDVFFHVTALQTRTVTPKLGDRGSLEFGKGKDGRVQALNIAIVGAPKPQSDANLLPIFARLVALEFIAGGAFAGYFPRQAGMVSLLASMAPDQETLLCAAAHKGVSWSQALFTPTKQ